MKVLPLYKYLFFFACSFVLSVALTPLFRRVALRMGRVAVPSDIRWHKKETALMGGVSIFMATVASWLLSARLTNWQAFEPYLPLVLCAAAVFVLGLVDDLFNVDPQHKLAAQIVITLIMLMFGFRLNWTSYEMGNLFLTIVWIVGITNAFNLLDNMDGLAAGVAFIAGTFLFLTHYLNPAGNPFTGSILLMSAVYLGAISGFLIYNFHPASIFMGDAGSLFIGFVLACLTTLVGSSGKSVGSTIGHLLSVIAIPILIVFIPIFDTGFVSVMRKLFRRPISQGGKDHSSHRMVAIGLSERKAVLVLYVFAVVSGLIALGVNYLSAGTALVLIVLYLLFVIFFWIYLGKVKVYGEDSVLSDGNKGAITPILVRFTYRRRLFEVLLDLILVTTAYYTAYLLRFEGPVYYLIGPDFEYFLKSLPIVVACQICCFYVMGIYRGVWESTSISDLVDYGKAITIGTVAAMLILLFLYRFYPFSRAVFVIYWVLMLVFVSLSRLSFRIVEEGIKRSKQTGRRALIYGAGVGGQIVAKEIENNPNLGLVLVGFVDDNPRKHRRKILGYPVLGGQNELQKIIEKKGVSEIIISFRKNGLEKNKEIRSLCQGMNTEVKVRQMKLTIS